MPSAPDYLQDRIAERFGDICDYGPIKYLESRGYKDFMYDWIKPTEDHVPTDEEIDCIDFLCFEYDWGGIVSKEEADEIAEAMSKPHRGSTNTPVDAADLPFEAI